MLYEQTEGFVKLIKWKNPISLSHYLILHVQVQDYVSHFKVNIALKYHLMITEELQKII